MFKETFPLRQQPIGGADPSSIGTVLSRTGSSSTLRSSPMTNAGGGVPFPGQKVSFTASPRSGGGMSVVSGSGSSTVGSPRSRPLGTGVMNPTQPTAGIFSLILFEIIKKFELCFFVF